MNESFKLTDSLKKKKESRDELSFNIIEFYLKSDFEDVDKLLNRARRFLQS
jgi:hypothetical protein